jgi:Ca2+-binding EF-hand superfamily protein
MVALSQATGNDPGSPIPPPIQAPGNTSDQALYDMDPFDSAPQKQMMDMLDRADRLSGGMGVALSPRQESMYRPKKKKKKKALYGTDYDHWNARGGVVGAHERKLAWQISGGGYEALEEAEKWIRRMDRNGDSYLSGKQIAAALREAGYDLTDSDVQIVLNGFGSDQYGRVDVSEFTQALHDIASGNDWYQQDYRIPVAGTGISGGGASDLPASQALNRSGEFMYGTAFNGVQSSYEGKWDGFDASRESNLVEAALKEIVEQISLIDISKLPGYGSGNRAAAILRPFKVCDKARKGIISITEVRAARRTAHGVRSNVNEKLTPPQFSACIEALGLVLTAGEVRALAHHFSVAVSPSKHGHEGVAIEYPPFARFVLEASTMNRFTGEGADDWGKPGATSGSGSWWEIVPQTAAKCQKAQKKAKSKSKFIKSLKSKIKKKANGSDIEGKHFSKALSSAGIKLPKSALEDLMGLLGGEDAVDWKAFLKVFKVKLEDVDDDNDEDDSDDDGSSGSDDGSDDDTSKDSDSGDSEDSESPSSLLKLFGKAMMMASDPRSWIDSVCYLFSECDMDGNGYLDPKEFLTLTKKVGVKLTKSEFKKLSAEMDDDGDGNVSYIEILSSLLKAFKSGANGGKAFLGDEREIAEKILDAMGENPGARRRWLSKLRKNFFSLDKFNNGTMQGPKLIRVLRDSGVRLSRSEEGRLLELLPTMEDEEGGGEDDASGSVSYRELLRFCASSAGKWYEQDVDLAEGLRSALRDKMRKKR